MASQEGPTQIFISAMGQIRLPGGSYFIVELNYYHRRINLVKVMSGNTVNLVRIMRGIAPVTGPFSKFRGQI